MKVIVQADLDINESDWASGSGLFLVLMIN